MIPVKPFSYINSYPNCYYYQTPYTHMTTEIRPLSIEEKSSMGLQSGLKVEKAPSWLRACNVCDGFIIITVGGHLVGTIDELYKVLEEGAIIEGIYPDGTETYYFAEANNF